MKRLMLSRLISARRESIQLDAQKNINYSEESFLVRVVRKEKLCLGKSTLGKLKARGDNVCPINYLSHKLHALELNKKKTVASESPSLIL